MSYESLSQGSIADLGNSYASLEFGGQYFRSDLDVKHFSPGWTAKHPLVFQVLPQIVHDVPQPAYIRTDGAIKPTDYYMRMPEVSMGSAEKVTIVLFDPFKERQGQYNAQLNPYILFRSKLRRLVYASGDKTYEGWKGLFMGSKGQSAALPQHRDRYFFNSVVWASTGGAETDIKNRPIGMQPDDMYAPIVSGTNSFGTAVTGLLKNRVEQGGDDLLTGQASYYFLAFNPEHCDIKSHYSPKDLEANLERMRKAQAASLSGGEGGLEVTEMAADEGDADSQFSKYHVVMLESCVVTKKQAEEGAKVKRLLLPERPFGQIARSMAPKVRPIRNMLVVPSHDEQVAAIARAFADKPEVLYQGFVETEYLNHPAVKKAFANRKAIPTGASMVGDAVDMSGGPNLMTSESDVDEISDAEMDELFDGIDAGAAAPPPRSVGQHDAARQAMRG